jgi:glycosyltransferase involved in cell wall biosynthesis
VTATFGQVAGAIFVVAGTTAGQQGPVAALVSAAGWADAARRVLGASWLVTGAGVVDPDEARRQASSPALASPGERGWIRHVPTVAKTAVKDVRQWRRASSITVRPEGPWTGRQPDFVWQRHELFSGAGIRLGRALGVPVVLFVPATLIWEARQWGVRRPGWGGLLERRVEAPALRAADLLACGSDLVAEQAVRLGVPADRVLVTPTGADVDAIVPGEGREATRAALGLGDRFVVGWVGSFRPFHGIERAVDAVAGLDGAVLLLVGDGPERPRIEALARERGVEAVTTGTVVHEEVPQHLAAMDAALVLAPPGGAFHYSPLKLAEYLAAGLPVVAPRVGQLEARLTDGVDAVLVEPDDAPALAAALRRLRDDPAARRRLGEAARAAAVERWSWDEQIRRITTALRSRR